MSERTMVIPAPVARPDQAVEVHNYRIKNRFVFEPGKCIGAKYTLVDGGFVTFGKWAYDVLLDRRNPSGDYMRLCVGDSGIKSVTGDNSSTVGAVEISVVNPMPADEIEKIRALLTYRKDIEGPGLDSVSPAQALALIAAWDAESEENIRLCGLYAGYESRAEQAEASFRDSIAKQAEMAAGIEKLTAANEGLAARAHRAEHALESALQVNAARQAEGIANILNGMMAGITGEKGSVRLELGGYHCPYCNEVSKTIEAATAHDATCPKHPAVIRAERAEAELASARAAGIEAMRRAEQADAVLCPICGAHGHIGDCEED